VRTGTPSLGLPSAEPFFPELFSPEHGRKKYQQCENFEAPEGHREAEQDLGGIGYIGVM
jgi:hypothetical protein